MAKITKETMALQYKMNSTDVQDDSITEIINSAYRFLSSFCGFRASDNTFFGWFDIWDSVYVYPAGVSDDITLTKITINSTDIDLTDDIEQVDRFKWEVTNESYTGYDRFYIEYTSDDLLAGVNNVLKEYILYHYKRLPGVGDFIHQTEERLEDQYIKKFISPRAFENQLARRLSAMFPKGVGSK